MVYDSFTSFIWILYVATLNQLTTTEILLTDFQNKNIAAKFKSFNLTVFDNVVMSSIWKDILHINN